MKGEQKRFVVLQIFLSEWNKSTAFQIYQIKVSMRFACLPRYEDHTHRLMRQARAGIILDEMRQRQQSFTETIYEPTKCVRYSRNWTT